MLNHPLIEENVNIAADLSCYYKFSIINAF